MTARDRRRLYAITRLLGAVPKPSGGGSQSATVAGVAGYAADAQDVIDFVIEALRGLYDPAPRDADPGLIYVDFDEVMGCADQWLARRIAQKWTAGSGADLRPEYRTHA